MAEAGLRGVLTDASRGMLAAMHSTGVTFKDATAEFLRFVAESHKRDAVTVRDYKASVLHGIVFESEGNREDGRRRNNEAAARPISGRP